VDSIACFPFSYNRREYPWGSVKRLFLVLHSGFQALALPAHGAGSKKEPCAIAGQNNAFLGIQTIRLWAATAPQAKGKACEDTPTLTIFEPQRGT
jgi:hypothetical protein